MPLFDEHGNRVVNFTPDGEILEGFYEIQVIEDVEVETVELHETDEYIYSIRYTELASAILAAIS